MKLWKVFSDGIDGRPYVSMSVVASTKEKAIEKLEKEGIKPDTWSGEWNIIEDRYVLF